MCDAENIWHVPDYKGAFFDRSRVLDPVSRSLWWDGVWLGRCNQAAVRLYSSVMTYTSSCLTFTFCWRLFLHFVILERSRPKRPKPRRAKRQTSNQNQKVLRTLIRTTCSMIYDPLWGLMSTVCDKHDFCTVLNCRSNKIVCFKSIFIVKMNWLNNKSLKKNTTF